MNSENIGYLLHHVSSILDRHSDQVLMERLGIGFSQFKILLVLLEKDGATQNSIAAQLGQTEASISRQIKLMTKQGLVVVRRSQQNRRQHHIFLTSKGDILTEKAMKILNDYHSPMFATLSAKEQENLLTTLKSIKNYLA